MLLLSLSATCQHGARAQARGDQHADYIPFLLLLLFVCFSVLVFHSFLLFSFHFFFFASSVLCIIDGRVMLLGNLLELLLVGWALHSSTQRFCPVWGNMQLHCGSLFVRSTDTRGNTSGRCMRILVYTYYVYIYYMKCVNCEPAASIPYRSFFFNINFSLHASHQANICI